MSAKIAWVLLTMIVLIPFSDFICLVLMADLFSETGLVKCGFLFRILVRSSPPPQLLTPILPPLYTYGMITFLKHDHKVSAI